MDEATLRLVFFLVVFISCAGLEWLRPNRQWRNSRLQRWKINLGLILLNTVIVRLTVGAVAVTAAVWAEKQGFGLLNYWQLPSAVSGLMGFLLLDFVIWCQHWITHRWSWLWRLHKVHHTDLELDVTTALRFHPIEILLSMLFKAGVVILLGINFWVVILFEAILNASAIFTHANIRISSRLDHLLRYLFCTPDMHRIHHSSIPTETNSNYGFFLSIWDRAFRTYRHQPMKGIEGMQIGLNGYQSAEKLRFKHLLQLPFKG